MQSTILRMLAANPLITEPPPIPPLLQAPYQAAVFACLQEAANAERVTALLSEKAGPPRPEQGGQRITEEWLRSLKDRDCLWRFR